MNIIDPDFVYEEDEVVVGEEDKVEDEGIVERVVMQHGHRH